MNVISAINISSTFHFPHVEIPLPQEVFPSKSSPEATALFIPRIHGHLGLDEWLDDRVVAVLGCQMQRCFASGAVARGQAAEPNEHKGRKFWENFGASKVEVWKCMAKIPFQMSWGHRLGYKTHELVLYSIEAVSAMLAVKMIWRKNVITLNSNTKQESKKDALLTCFNCSVSHIYMFYTEITYNWKPVFLLIAADFEMASLAPKPRPLCGNRAVSRINP